MPSYFHFDQVAEQVVCGPDVAEHVTEIEAFVEAGYDHVYVHQIGPDQRRFLEVFEVEVLPSFA